MNSKLITLSIVLLVIAVGGYFLLSDRSDPTLTTDRQNQSTTTGTGSTSSTNGTAGTSNVANRANTVSIGENVTGNFAIITEAKLARPGFVVVYRVNSNSESEVLGNSALLSPSTHTNLRIQLSGVVSREQTLVAVLHEDDGDGQFEFPASDFYLGNASERVVMDADVVDVSSPLEKPVLEEQVEIFLKQAYSTSSSSINE